MNKFDKNFITYLNSIKEIIETNYLLNNSIGRSIRAIRFSIGEVDANFQYFKDCYDDGQTPENAVLNISYNEDVLFRKLTDVSDKFILDEVDNRYLSKDVISDASTDDLEDEIEDRWDCTMVKKSRLTLEEIIELLEERRCRSDYGTPKQVICETLGFYNSYSVTNDEIIEKLKEKLNIW